MDELTSEPGFTALYGDARSALEQGYIRADQCVYNFAMDFGISPEDAWRLITQEASERGDEVVHYLSEHPLDERSYAHKNAERQARRFTDRSVHHLAEWWRHRGD